MNYLYAFLIGGILCCITQFLFDKSRKSVVFILTLAYCIGILATLLGWIAPLGNIGQSGDFLLLFGAGQASFDGMAALLAGNPSANVRYLLLVSYCFAVGLAGGFILNHRKKH